MRNCRDAAANIYDSKHTRNTTGIGKYYSQYYDGGLLVGNFLQLLSVISQGLYRIYHDDMRLF